jgi:hypothetical protein
MRFLKYLAFAGMFVALPAFGATLSFVASQGYKVGDTIPVSVVVSSAASINGVGASVNYSGDLLELVSFSKAASVINFWAQEPASSGAGQASLQGIIFDPGYTGQGGRVVQMLFRAKAAGTALLSFSDAQVLANDGKGTNVLTAAPALALGITAAASAAPAPAPAPTPAAVTPAPAAPQNGLSITSSTHPDQTKWYNSNKVSLDWKNLAGTSAVRIGYDTEPKGTPSVVYGAITHKDLSLKDGVWYFHVQDQTSAGWSATATYKLSIDTVPPLPIPLSFPHGATTTDPRPVALFNTTDALSGIDHYAVKVNGGGLTTISTDKVSSNPYALPEQDPGVGTLQVVAYDSAGNSTQASGVFEVTGIQAPKLDPVGDINAGDILQISGVTAPNARVDAWIVSQDGSGDSQWARSSANGAFRIIWTKSLAAGAYTLQAQTTDDKGAVSRKTDPVTFNVLMPVLFKLGPITVIKKNAEAAGVGLGILALILLGYAVWHALKSSGRPPRRGAVPSHAALHKQFTALKAAVAHEVRALEKVRDKRKLTAEEERLINRLGALIEKSEEKIEQEIESALGE